MIDIYIDANKTTTCFISNEGHVKISKLKIPRDCNEAEYISLLIAIKAIYKLGYKTIRVFSDSLFMVQLLNGKRQSNGFQSINAEALSLLNGFDDWKVIWISRKDNIAGKLLSGKNINVKDLK